MNHPPLSNYQTQEAGIEGEVANQITLLSPSPPARTHISYFILTVYIFLALILTYPLLFNLTQAVPNDIGDPLLNTWILAWDSHAMLTDPLDLFNANIFYPLPNTLAYSEHLFSTALLVLPCQLIFGEPVLAYNLSLLMTFPLAAFGMYLLTLHWTRRRRAAFIAGLIFGFAPYRFSAIAHLQLLTFQWLPFALLCVDKITSHHWQPAFSRPPTADCRPQQRQSRFDPVHFRFGLALIIFLILQILASWYLAVYTALIVGLYIVVGFASRRFRLAQLPTLAAILLLTLGLTLLFALPYVGLIDALRQARPLSLALAFAAHPTDFIAAAPFNRLFGPLTAPFRSRPSFTEENMMFLGFAAPLLAMAAFVSLLIHFLKRIYSAFNSHPHVAHFPILRLRAGQVFPSPHSSSYSLLLTSYFLLLLILCLALTFPAPYAGLTNLLPAATVVRVPPRWIIPALFALAGLAATGYTRINDQLVIIKDKILNRQPPRFPSISNYQLLIINFLTGPTSLFLICTCLLLLETLSIPIPLAPIQNHNSLNPAYHWLADQAQSTGLALVELPLHSAPAPEYPEVKRLYASTLGWWRLVNGYSGYTPPRQPDLAQALAAFPHPPAIHNLQSLITNNSSTIAHHSSLSSSLPLYLLIHPGEAPLDRRQWETTGQWLAERNSGLHPIGQFEGDYLYQVLPPDATRFAGPPLATFGLNQKIQLLELTIESNPLRTTPYAPRLILFWQPIAPLPADYTVFIHLRAPDGFVRSQADGPPVSNHYPTGDWQPGEIIQDIHPLPVEDSSQVDHLAIGLYDPATGKRLPAFGPDGERLADDALVVPLP